MATFLYRKLLAGLMLGTQALSAIAQSPPPASNLPSDAQAILDKFPALRVSTAASATPAQQEAIKAAAESRRIEFERKLDERFVVAGNEVYDKKTDLTWQRCNYGQTWDEENHWCKGVIKHTTVDVAISEVSQNGGPWRVPNADEVISLLEVACGNTKKKDAIAPIFPEVSSSPLTYYLTASTRANDNISAAQCQGGFGPSMVGLNRKYVAVLRLVRSGK